MKFGDRCTALRFTVLGAGFLGCGDLRFGLHVVFAFVGFTAFKDLRFELFGTVLKG